MPNILGWLFSWLGPVVLNAFVTWIERQWPGSKPLIDMILKWLGQGVPPQAIASHLAAFEHPNKS